MSGTAPLRVRSAAVSAIAFLFGLAACANVLGVEDVTMAERSGPGCTYPSECPSLPTTPANCAIAECIGGACVYKALDTDRDEHPAAKCKSQDGTKITTGDDCDDTDAQIYPGHPGPCAEVDGKPISFPGGTPLGICSAGTRSCNDDGSVGACVGTVGPASETTCTPEIDEDCDGNALEACTCVSGETAACGPTDVGVCAKGVATCGGNNQFGPCVGAVLPAARNCGSSEDFNCNGVADSQEPECQCAGGGAPNAVRACDGHGALDGVGVCKAGSQTCTPAGATSAWSACGGSVGPSAEECDAFDRNCNGVAGVNEPSVAPPSGTMNCAVTYACPAAGRGALYYRTGIGFTNYAGGSTLWTGYAPRGDFASGAYPPGTHRISHDATGTKMGPTEIATACCASGCSTSYVYTDGGGQFFTP